MKAFFNLVVACCSFFLLNIQQIKSQAFVNFGDKKIHVGFRGFGNGTGVMGSFDYGINNWFSLGSGADFYFKGDSDVCVFGRANFHLGEFLNLNSNMDLYPGIDLGIMKEKFQPYIRLGFRYFFSEKVGAFIELGNHAAFGTVLKL